MDIRVEVMPDASAPSVVPDYTVFVRADMIWVG
jgi:hypothetical protein